jgi:hypothetical protein
MHFYKASLICKRAAHDAHVAHIDAITSLIAANTTVESLLQFQQAHCMQHMSYKLIVLCSCLTNKATPIERHCCHCTLCSNSSATDRVQSLAKHPRCVDGQFELSTATRM